MFSAVIAIIGYIIPFITIIRIFISSPRVLFLRLDNPPPDGFILHLAGAQYKGVRFAGAGVHTSNALLL